MSSDSELEPGSLEFKMNTAVLRMNNKLKEDGFNERERAFMWGMTVSELRVFLTQVWEHLHTDKTLGKVDEELDPAAKAPSKLGEKLVAVPKAPTKLGEKAKPVQTT